MIIIGILYGTFRIDGGGEGGVAITGVMEGTVTVGTNSSHTWKGCFASSNPEVSGPGTSSGTYTFESLTGNALLSVAGVLDGNIHIKGEIGPDAVLVVYVVRPEGRIVINSARRDNKNMRGTIRFFHSEFLNLVAWHQGTLEILDSQAGAGGNGGELIGTVDHQGFFGWLSTGTLRVEGNMSGTVRVNTVMQGTITFEKDFSGDINIVCEDTIEDDCDEDVGGNLAGLIEVYGDMSGQITVVDGFGTDQSLPGVIRLDGALMGTGRILIDGLADGAIAIGQETVRTSLIRATEGLGPNGSITINDGAGNFNANGTIHIGPTAWITLPPVTFDGPILIKKDGNGSGGGALFGDIDVIGCHDPADQLDICICCTTCPSTSVTVVQDGCDPLISTPEWACLSGCP